MPWQLVTRIYVRIRRGRTLSGLNYFDEKSAISPYGGDMAELFNSTAYPFVVNLTAAAQCRGVSREAVETVVLVNSSDANATIFSGC